MQKNAVPNPKFKALKQHKKNWNLAAKEFVARMIALKKAINGRGDSKYSLPAGRLQNPVPNEIVNFLNTLSSNYEAVASEALKIISEQNDFASERAQSKLQKSTLANDIEALPKAASVLISEGSSNLSRFWAYLKSPFLSEENKRLRISLLRGLAALDKSLEDFEGYILSSGDKSIFKAIEKLITVDSEFAYVYTTFDSVFEMEKKEKERKKQEEERKKQEGKVQKEKPAAPLIPGNIKPDESSIEKAESAILDAQNLANIPNATNSKLNMAFDKLIINYKHEKDRDKKIKMADSILITYKYMLDLANRIHKKNAPTFAQLFEEINKNKAVEEIKTVASNFLTRWLKKKIHRSKPFDRTSGNRLDIQAQSEMCREIIDDLMNALEHDLSEEKVTASLKILLQELVKLKGKLTPFRALFKGKTLEKAFDPDHLFKMVFQDPDDKQVQRIERQYDNIIDRRVLDKIL